MIWRSRHVLLFVFLLIGTSLSKSLENEPDTLNDDKVSSSISQLLRSLESDKGRPTQIITKHGIMTATPGRTDKHGRKLYFGDPQEHITSSITAGSVPDPVVVSSQAIHIASGSGSNGTGGKRGRSLRQSTIVDKDGVRTIEGVRVPDDEHDKFYTWRNARVIKNFLVSNDRPANPQRKRQILIQDARQYLNAAASQQQQQQQQQQSQQTATIIDASSLTQQPQSAQTIYYAQTQPQASHHTQTTILQGGDLTAALYAAAAAQQQVGQQQQQVYQYPATSSSNGQQTTAYSYTPQQGQMYVLQPDGKTYLPYTPTQVSSSSSSTGPEHYQQSQQYGQASQFASRSGEVESSNSAEHSQPNYQQAAAAIQRYQQQLQLQQLKKQQQEQEYKQHILSKHQSHLQQQQQQQQQQTAEAAQSVTSQQQQSVHPHVSVTPLSGQGTLSTASPSAPSSLLHKTAQVQNLASIAATALPTGASIGQQLQEQVSQFNLQLQPQVAAAAAAQHHPNGQIVPISGTTLFHVPPPPPPSQQQQQTVQIQHTQPAIEDRNGNGNLGNVVGNGGPMAVSPSQFVIQPQTYLSGGGQVFTVPVPIPADQFTSGSEQHHVQHHENHHAHSNSNNKDRHRDDHNNKNKDSKGNYANRLMESLQINRKAMERIETSGVVVPVLTTAGIFLGFGALAAGWYLSKSNREVGILRRTGKPSITPNLNLGSLATKSTSDKDHAIVSHLRRKRNTDEVDQASFFQSIIQHGIEKQQTKFDEPAQPNFGGFNNGLKSDQVQIKPMSFNNNNNYNNNYNQQQQSQTINNRDSDNSKVTRSDRDRDRDRHDDNTDRHGKGGHGKGGSHISKVKNFAKVAIPAVILGGSVVIIGALIFGWYVSGSNREIAFLEPSAYSRRKRSLNDNLIIAQSSPSTSPVIDWLQRTLTSIHKNPYETEAHLQPSLHSSSSRGDKGRISRKSTFITDYDLTSLAVAMSLAAFTFGSLTVLALAWYFTDNSREVGWADKGPYSFGHWPTSYKHHPLHHGIHRRSIVSNDMTLDLPAHNTGFLHKILDNLEVSQSSLLNKLQENGAYDKWQETPCAKRIFCDIMSGQGDDTIRMMEKRMTKFLTMLPESLAQTLGQTLGDVMIKINTKDCSAYTCGDPIAAYSPRR